MFSAARKYALDSTVLISAFRHPARNETLVRFRSAFGPFEYLNAVVVQELRAGARTNEASRLLERHVFDVFERRGRIFTPSFMAWKRVGEALAGLAVREGRGVREFGRTFVNDALLAASCRERGIVLITENVRDFARLKQVMAFEFLPALDMTDPPQAAEIRR